MAKSKPKAKKVVLTTIPQVKKYYVKKYDQAKATLKSAQKVEQKNQKTLKTKKQELSKLKPGTAAYKAKERTVAKGEKTVRADAKKVSKAKSGVKKALYNKSRYKKSSEASAIFKKKVLSNLKKSSYFNKRAYIIPVKPWAENSFVFIFTMDQSPASTNSSVQNPTEKGKFTTTGGQRQPLSLSVTGYLGGSKGSKMSGLLTQVRRLRRWLNNSTPISWYGDETIKSAKITSFTPDFSHDVGTGGTNVINVSLTIEETNYAISNEKKKKKKTKDVGSRSVKKGSKKGKTGNKKTNYLIAKSGMTYISIAKKEGTTVAKLRSLNKYSDRKIPIGAKIYY